MFKIFKLLVPALVYIGIVVLNSSAMADIAKCDWFTHVTLPGRNYDNCWGYTSPLFDYAKVWKDPKATATHMVKNGVDINTATMNAHHLQMTVEELVEIKTDVSKGDWYKYSLNHITALLKATEKMWDKAVKMYFKDGNLSSPLRLYI